MLKVYKLQKRDYSNLFKLYKRLTADATGQANPDKVFISGKDVPKFKKGILDLLRRNDALTESKSHNEKLLSYNWLDFGPNESLVDGVAPGYILYEESSKQEGSKV